MIRLMCWRCWKIFNVSISRVNVIAAHQSNHSTIPDNEVHPSTTRHPSIYTSHVYLNPLPADSFSKYKTKVIPNKVCIIRLYTIKYCIFRVI